MQGVKELQMRLDASHAPMNAAAEVELRQGRVYALPDGTELVVGVGRASHYFLYHPIVWQGRAWIVNMPIAYEIDGHGRLHTRTGELTTWRIEDLTDTNRTAERDASGGAPRH